MVDETMPFPSKRLLTPFRGRSGSYSSFWGLFSPKASGLIWKNGVSSCPHATDLQKRGRGVVPRSPHLDDLAKGALLLGPNGAGLPSAL